MKMGTAVLIILLLSICLMPGAVIACTTFVLDNNGQPVYGKNIDWTPVVPGFAIVNKRGVAKISLPFSQEPDAKQISWTSTFGSVTFNFFGREFPWEGINEAGLFVSAMGLRTSEYPPTDSRPPVTILQWVQYQLDNFSTVDEVIASDQNMRIMGDGGGTAHYLVSDSKGNCASIEWLGGEMVCHTGAAMPYKVMVGNKGTYDQGVAYLNRFWGYGGILPILHPVFFRDYLPRFAIAADMVQKFSTLDSWDAVAYAFKILKNVEINPIYGSAVWSSVYDSSNRQIHFRSRKKSEIRSISLSTFDFSCTTPVKVLDVSTALSGDVSNSFVDYTKDIDLEMLRGWMPQQPEDKINMYAAYPDNKTTCTE
jgi:penicillin V acylase-like amidase (Ntn superfamily)